MLCRKFELIPIKIGFFMNFKSCSKIRSKTMGYSTWSLAKFRQKWQGENIKFSDTMYMYKPLKRVEVQQEAVSLQKQLPSQS